MSTFVRRVLVVAVLAAALAVVGSPDHYPASAQEGEGPPPILWEMPFSPLGVPQSGPALAEAGDQHGSALATGDFDGNGIVDLVVGAPGEDIAGRAGTGAALVTFGQQPNPVGRSVNPGMVILRRQVLSQRGDYPGLLESDDQFGASFAVGDFNGDGIDDLAVGVPGEDIDTRTDAGAVAVFLGSPTGFVPMRPPIIESMSGGTSSEAGDRFGSALATGDFDGDGRDELAVGAPNDAVNGIADAGLVSVFTFSTSGVVSGARQFHLGEGAEGGLTGAPGTGDLLGSALTVLDMNGDGHLDLAAAAPGAAVDGEDAAGVVHVLLGSDQGLNRNNRTLLAGPTAGMGSQFGAALATLSSATRDALVVGAPGYNVAGTEAGAAFVLLLTANGEGIVRSVLSQDDGPGTPETGDQFGSALAVGDLNRDGHPDIVVGIPGEDVPEPNRGNFRDAGVVGVFWGTATDETFVPGRNGSQTTLRVEHGDRFGAAVAVADLGGNGRNNLIVGSPYESLRGAGARAGIVDVTENANLSEYELHDLDPVIANPALPNEPVTAAIPLAAIPAMGGTLFHACPAGAERADFQSMTVQQVQSICDEFLTEVVHHVWEGDAPLIPDDPAEVTLDVAEEGRLLLVHSESPWMGMLVEVQRSLVEVTEPLPTLSAETLSVFDPGATEWTGDQWPANVSVEVRMCAGFPDDLTAAAVNAHWAGCDLGETTTTTDNTGRMAFDFGDQEPDLHPWIYVAARVPGTYVVSYRANQRSRPFVRAVSQFVAPTGDWPYRLDMANQPAELDIWLVSCPADVTLDSLSVPDACDSGGASELSQIGFDSMPQFEGMVHTVDGALLPLLVFGDLANPEWLTTLGPVDVETPALDARLSYRPDTGSVLWGGLSSVPGEYDFALYRCAAPVADLTIPDDLTTCDASNHLGEFDDYVRFEFAQPLFRPTSLVAVLTDRPEIVLTADVVPPNLGVRPDSIDSAGPHDVAVVATGFYDGDLNVRVCFVPPGPIACPGPGISVVSTDGLAEFTVSVVWPPPDGQRLGLTVQNADGQAWQTYVYGPT